MNNSTFNMTAPNISTLAQLNYQQGMSTLQITLIVVSPTLPVSLSLTLSLSFPLLLSLSPSLSPALLLLSPSLPLSSPYSSLFPSPLSPSIIFSFSSLSHVHPPPPSLSSQVT